MDRSFSLALLALLGSLVLAGTLVAQQWLWDLQDAAALYTLLAQTLLTGLLALPLCSLQVLLWRSFGQFYAPRTGLRS